MTNETTTYYYRIYDDKEQFSYIRTSFQEKKVRDMLKSFENVHQEYYNSDFVEFLREADPKAELIEVTPISY